MPTGIEEIAAGVGIVGGLKNIFGGDSAEDAQSAMLALRRMLIKKYGVASLDALSRYISEIEDPNWAARRRAEFGEQLGGTVTGVRPTMTALSGLARSGLGRSSLATGYLTARDRGAASSLESFERGLLSSRLDYLIGLNQMRGTLAAGTGAEAGALAGQYGAKATQEMEQLQALGTALGQFFGMRRQPGGAGAGVTVNVAGSPVLPTMEQFTGEAGGSILNQKFAWET